MQRDRSAPLAQRVYDALLADIGAEQRRAGERLGEADIARAANVSRIPVREALGRRSRVRPPWPADNLPTPHKVA